MTETALSDLLAADLSQTPPEDDERLRLAVAES